LTQAWMQGDSIHEIAESFFTGGQTKTITAACKAIYKNLANTGTWGLSALSKLPNSGIDFDKLTESERRRINTLPAMIYHGVKTEEAVLMRMNSAPRSVAARLGEEMKVRTGKSGGETSVNEVRDFLKSMGKTDWERMRPNTATLSGSDYKNIWELLSGERGVFMF
ncbi:MAG: DEAD/DEAH box helicase, partial [Desulfobacteria bacterium]